MEDDAWNAGGMRRPGEKGSEDFSSEEAMEDELLEEVLRDHRARWLGGGSLLAAGMAGEEGTGSRSSPGWRTWLQSAESREGSAAWASSSSAWAGGTCSSLPATEMVRRVRNSVWRL